MPQYTLTNPVSYAVQIMSLLAQIPDEYLLADEIASGLGEPPDRVDYVRKKLNEAFKWEWLKRRRVDLEVPYRSDIYVSHTRIKKGWEWAITNKGLGYLAWLKEDVQREAEEDVQREAEEETRRRASLRVKPRPKPKYATIEFTPELERLIEEAEEAPEELEAPPKYLALPPPASEEEEEIDLEE